MLGLEINDRSFALARDGSVTALAPSIVTAEGGSPASGRLRLEPAQVSTQHWRELARAAQPPARSLASAAAELRARLAVAPQGEPLWVAAPARFDARALGTVLGLLRAIGREVAGFVDSGTVTVAALETSGTALVLDLGLHEASVAAIEARPGAGPRRRRALNSARGGLLELQEAWLQLIAQAMVQRTRFDPLHEARSEQQLFDQLPGITAQAALGGRATAVAERLGQRYEIELGREQFGEAAESVYREIMRLLHELRPAGARVTLIVPRIVEQLPGLAERLQAFEDCELVTVPEGLAAAAASTLPLPPGAADGAVRFLRRLPARLAVAEAATAVRSPLGRREARAAAASHLLHAGRAYPLGDAPMVVGRRGRAADEAPTIELPEGLAAVSRRHCTLLREGSELLLVDHSRYGTFVNGERVAGRTRLRAGDALRLGDPAIELALIAVDPSAR